MNPPRKQQQPVPIEIPTIEIPKHPNTLSLVERKDLERCELQIRTDYGAFLRVARALLEIKEGKLYREKHSSFEQYCKETWGFHRQYAYRLLCAAEVWAKMVPMGTIPPPDNERQLRAMRGLSVEQTTAVWKLATEIAGDRTITSDIVKKAVAEVCPQIGTKRRPKLYWQVIVEPLLKQALRMTKSGDKDAVEQLVQRVQLLLGVGQRPKSST